MTDQRLLTRRRVIGRIEVLASDGSTSLIGSLFNISDSGAMISIPAGYEFPSPFFIRN